MTKTFHGFIETTKDSLLVFEACRQGILPKVNHRLNDQERKSLVESGSVFVFDEKESKIKRWTDGLLWSPSRVLGNFMIYRELEKGITLPKPLRKKAIQPFRFKKNGLIKKAIMVEINNTIFHLVSYHTKYDFLNRQLVTPSSLPYLASIQIPSDLVMNRNLKIPLAEEYDGLYLGIDDAIPVSYEKTPCLTYNDSLKNPR